MWKRWYERDRFYFLTIIFTKINFELKLHSIRLKISIINLLFFFIYSFFIDYITLSAVAKNNAVILPFAWKCSFCLFPCRLLGFFCPTFEHRWRLALSHGILDFVIPRSLSFKSRKRATWSHCETLRPRACTALLTQSREHEHVYITPLHLHRRISYSWTASSPGRLRAEGSSFAVKRFRNLTFRMSTPVGISI